MALLTVNDLRLYFYMRAGLVRAVDGVSFSLDGGEILGIVGESGSGKSVLCYTLLGLVPQPPGRVETGEAVFDGVDLLRCGAAALRGIRGRRISMVFQDPMTSLNPYLRVSTQVTEPLRVHEGLDRDTALARAVQALREVGIQDAAERIHCYPDEFSGGMRQRVMIAMALITRPEILIADEPTTALDVTLQAEILALMAGRQRELGTAIVFVTHDLGVVAGFCDRVAVMYAGRFLEVAPTRALYRTPQHPYTAALQRSIPALHRRGETLYTIPGRPPGPATAASGCPFRARCEFAAPACSAPVVLREVRPNHTTACVRVQAGELQLLPSGARGAGRDPGK